MDNRGYTVTMRAVAASCARTLTGVLCVLMLAGCATLTEGAKGLLGISTKVLDQNRKSAVTKEFDRDGQVVYAKILKALDAISSRIYHRQAPSMVALYVSDSDTTAVGIYITPVGAARARVEVSSASTFAKEYIAKRLFARLEGRQDPFEEKKAEDAQVKNVQVLPQQEPSKRLDETK